MIGQRLRQARQEAGLSQRQLCGDVITRNMLSQIENGSARPSMDTLQYLARRLGKPVGYFLEEDTAPAGYTILENARNAYCRSDFSDCLQTLDGWEEDPGPLMAERYLLEAVCALDLAQQVAAEGKTAYALSLLERAEAAEGKTPYLTEELTRKRALLHYRLAPEQASRLAALLPSQPEEFLLPAEGALQQGDALLCGRILDAAGQHDARWHLLRGKSYYVNQEHAQAIPCLQQAEQDFPKETAVLLEKCYQSLEDYKMAYHYACKQRQL